MESFGAFDVYISFGSYKVWRASGRAGASTVELLDGIASGAEAFRAVAGRGSPNLYT